MGDNFNLKNWCDTWLKSSGVNILEPVVALNADGTLQSLKVKQSNGLRGQNRLHTHKLSIAIYEKAFNKGDQPFVIDNVLVSESDEVTEIDTSKIPSDFVVGAINVNHDEHAYSKVRYDPQSVEWFKDNLHLVQHPLTRGAIWRSFWILTVDKKMTSLQYMEFVQKQLVHEDVEQIVAAGLLTLTTLIGNYLPIDVIAEKEHALFDILVSLLQKEGMIKDPIVD